MAIPILSFRASSGKKVCNSPEKHSPHNTDIFFTGSFAYFNAIWYSTRKQERSIHEIYYHR